MRLRTRVQAELHDRLTAHLPQALATIWDHQAVVVAVEQLTYKPAGGARGGWAYLTDFSGVIRAELRGDDVDALPVEALICDLMRDPILLLADLDTPAGDLTEAARLTLIETRDTIRDMDVATGLRFAVQGHILGRAPDPTRPEAVMVGHAPQIGADHQGDYQDTVA